jgi:hypothetical protein
MPIFRQQPGPDNLPDVLENKSLRIGLGGRSDFPRARGVEDVDKM